MLSGIQPEQSNQREKGPDTSFGTGMSKHFRGAVSMVQRLDEHSLADDRENKALE